MVQTLLVQGLTLVVNVGTGVITARVLGPTGRGEFAAVSLWLLIPPMLAVSGLHNSVIYLTGREPKEANSVAAAGLIAATLAFLPIAATCFVLLPWLMHSYRPEIVGLARLILVLSIVNVWSVMSRQGLLAVKNFRAYNIAGFGMAFLYLVLLLGLVILGAISPRSAALAPWAGTTIAVMLTVQQLVKNWHWRALRPLSRMQALLRYGMKAAPSDVVTVLNSTSDRLVLVALVPAAEFGVYAVAVSFARLLYVVQTAVSTVMLADLAGKTPREMEIFVHRTFRLLLWLLVVGCATLYLFDTQLLSAVYGSEFAQAAPAFRILLFEGAVTCISQMLIQAYLAAEKPSLPSLLQVVSFSLGLAGMIALAPIYGAIGAASALAAASTLRFVLLLANLHRIGLRLPNPFPGIDDFAPLLNRLRRMTGVPRGTTEESARCVD